MKRRNYYGMRSVRIEIGPPSTDPLGATEVWEKRVSEGTYAVLLDIIGRLGMEEVVDK